MISIGIAGTAKNTGKTTTLMTLLTELKQAGKVCVGLTGIGYDGESFDNVTGLPKPRIDVYEGMIVAVAQRCFKFSRAKVETLLTTDIMTPLGNIVVGRVMSAGKLVLAGPTKKSELRRVLDILGGFGAAFCIVDGALSRIVPFTEVDGLLLATGASRNSDIAALAAESKCMIELLNLPVLEEKGRAARFDSVMSDAHYEAFLSGFAAADTMCIGGVLTGRYLKKLAEDDVKGKRLIFSDSLKLLLADDMDKTRSYVRQLAEKRVETGVAKPIRVIAITVNPYYPKYRFSNQDYEPAYVDKDELKRAVGAGTGLTCYDVVQQGGRALIQDIDAFCRGLGGGIRLI